MHIVTDEWIVEHTIKHTEEGISAINASQAKILGLEWHELTKGWKSRVIGLQISNAGKELFELLCAARGSKKQMMIIEEFKRSQKKPTLV